ncbi:MAG: 30S ribosomal protein S6 [Caldilineae bacterium]|nr:30S ribosomal protein S6 [Anaerolineae bacterium]MCB0204993.1 30S ribosomal protein S6 [Anaerolineae bacterium]MCB0255532.1 30S ribosomal protein S6 [Anaerolineae bacterium]MCB9154624.1 30S ribosomal protein S6 [Caldilineae bacterium]
MNEYELMYIVHPEADKDGVTVVSEQLASWISEQGGEISKTNVWGRRKLAYAIKKQTEGTYVVVDLKLDGEALSEVERNVKLHEQVLRYMFIRKDN